MGFSIREQIIQDVVEQVEMVRIANGFNTDLGLVASRIKTFDENTAEALVVVPRPEESAKGKYAKMSHTMPLDLNAFKRIGTGENISTVGEEIYSDLIKILTDPADNFSMLINSIEHTGGGPQGLPSNEDKVAAVVANFEIKYKTALGNPEAQ